MMRKFETEYTDPSPKIIRRYIEQQTCWICGKGGWEALSQHLVKKHGLPAREVREMAYMFKRERLISEDLSGKLSIVHKSHLDRVRIPWAKGKPKTKILSSRAKEILRKRIKEIHPIGPMHEDTKKKISEILKQSYRNGKIPWNKLARLKRVHDVRSQQAREYWRKFKELPPEEQRRLTLEHAASRRVRINKNCEICGKPFEVIPSQFNKQFSCGNPKCRSELCRRRATGRKHTPEAIAKMSVHAKKRHINEPRFGK